MLHATAMLGRRRAATAWQLEPAQLRPSFSARLLVVRQQLAWSVSPCLNPYRHTTHAPRHARLAPSESSGSSVSLLTHILSVIS
eukprot:7391611-Prymnesium_polylepis.1